MHTRLAGFATICGEAIAFVAFATDIDLAANELEG